LKIFFKTKLFNVINPENIDFKDFINILQKANLIIITWGSALTNLIFCNPGTQVIILKSQSYENESIQLFNKIIKNNSLIVKIILHKNNEIDLNELNETIDF
jgi:capsular polysaccharide biosynthesis protein